MSESKKSRIQILRDAIKAAQKAPNRATADVPFRSKYIPLVKVQVRSDFPMYRIQNGRTHKKHLAYLRKHPELPKDFFDDPEDPKVQAAQHEILLELISEGELDIDLQEKKQRTPIVLTYDGYIVDGNRRVAALRNQKQQFVTAVILPEDADRLDIFETEFELQLVRDTKAEYDWLDELIHLRYGLEELGGKLDDFAKRKRMSREDLKDDMGKLHMVEMYLDWLGEPGAFDRIPDEARGGSMRQAFTELTDKIRSKAVNKLSRNARDTIKHACFAAIHNQEGYQAIRNIINHLTKNANRVVERLVQDAKVAQKLRAASDGKAANEPKKDNAKKKNDPLRQLAAAESAATPDVYNKLDAVLSKPEDAKAVVTAIVTAANNMEDEDKDSRRQAIYLIELAVAKLSKVELSPTDDHTAIAKALAKVSDHVQRLADEIEALRKAKK